MDLLRQVTNYIDGGEEEEDGQDLGMEAVEEPRDGDPQASLGSQTLPEQDQVPNASNKVK